MSTLHARFTLSRTTDDGTDQQTVGYGTQFPSGFVICQIHLNDPPTLEGAISIDAFTATLTAAYHIEWIDPPTKEP